jgi:serine/threonine protein kinase/tetratricopeptide (TPR) repeat protein
MKDSPQLLSIFCEARERPSAVERAAYLDQACGDDAVLRARVEALLRAEPEVGNFLRGDASPPVLDATADDRVTERPGTVIGPYKLLEQIGEGGFGVVFMAEQQQPIRRKVALKVLKPGMDTRQVVARFEAERQALALMDHPNIAHVYDGGTTASSRPYFVMELVRGVPVTDFCDQNRQSIRERLELFINVCQAVQHAHQKGIIHRDIKPSNVLVTLQDDQPLVKVIDFGIAKATGQQLTDKTLFTNFAQMIGTPLYMSPEQAQMTSLDVDTRSDVYSLGVLLYELLTGTTPFDKERLRTVGYDEIRRIIREEEPPKPSTRISTMGRAATTASANRKSESRKLSQLFRGELDWIVMKALEKDRNRRYETASAFAADVQRYLNDEPVQACPPSAWYRFRKFARRNKTVLMTSTMVACALVVGTAIATWQAIRARQAEGLVQVELREKDEQFKRAEGNFLQTLNAVDELLTEVGEKELWSVPQLEQVRRRLLEKALKFFQEFLKARSEDSTVRFEAGLAYRRVGDIQRLLGRHGPAEEACQKAIDQLDDLSGEHPQKPLYRHELARAYSSRATILAELGRREAMEQDYRQARVLLETLAKEYPDRPDYRADLASTCQRWGGFLADTKPTEGVELLRQGLRLLQELAEKFPNQPEYAKDLVRCYGNLARFLKDLGQVDEAAKSFERGIEVVVKALEKFSRDQDFRFLEQVSHQNYGVFLWYRGRIPDAEKEFRHAAKLGEQLAADFPGIPRYRSGLAGSYSNLGRLLFSSGSAEKAEEPLRQGMAITDKLAAEFPTMPNYRSEAGLAMDSLALLLSTRQRYTEARTLLVRAMEHQEAAHALDPANRKYRNALGIHATNLAFVLKDMKAPAKEVDEAYERTIALTRALVKDYPEDAEYHSNLGKALNNWAALLRDRGRPEKAVSLLEEAVKCQQTALKTFPRNPLYLDSLRRHYMVLAEVLIALDRTEADDAIRGVVTAAADLEAVSPEKAQAQSGLGAVLHNLALLLRDRDRLEPARQLLEQAVRHQLLALKTSPGNHGYLVFLRNHYWMLAEVHKRLKQFAAAEESYRQCIAVLEKLIALRPDEPDYQSDLGAKLNDQSQMLGNDPRVLAEKRQLLEQAIIHQEAAVKHKPENATYRRFLGLHYRNLGITLLQQGHKADAEMAYQRCLAVREKLEQEQPENATFQVDLADIKSKLKELSNPESTKKDQ